MSSNKRPNLLFVFADQMRGMDMRCAGNGDMHTPNLDRLAREGVRSTHCFATVPICGPNRAVLLTGTYCTTNGVLLNDQALRTDLPTLGTIAKHHGYRTGYIGKWHLDGGDRDAFTPPGPRRGGFDFWSAYNCTHEYFNTRYYRDSPEVIRAEGYEPEIQTDLALEFLQGDTESPFCLVVSWGPPHNPYEEVPDKYRSYYDPDKITLRPNIEDIDPGDLDPKWSLRPTTADYYAAITALDEQVGRLLAQLEADGRLEDTIVVFTSDHGDMMWSQGLLYKCVPFEESISVPLLMRGPGLPAGSTCDTLIGTVDLLPTLCGLLGWECPSSVEGLDLSAAARGELGAPRPSSVFIAQYTKYTFRKDRPTPVWRGVRTYDYTYAESWDRQPWLFFNTSRDRYQQHNLIHHNTAFWVMSGIALELERWLRQLNDPFLPRAEMLEHYKLTAPQFVY